MDNTEQNFIYAHGEYCHCSDWKADICPSECFRARLTKELKEANPPYPYPVSFANFKSSGYCPMTEGEQYESI